METHVQTRLVRHSTPEDLETIISLIDIGRTKMRQIGNLKQWTKGDPKPELLKRDIDNGNSYIVEENGIPVATFAFVPGPDETYKKIYEGKWLDDTTTYSVIHRMAAAMNVHGIFDTALDYCFRQTNNIRLDTHRDNVVMRKLFETRGFVYCGIIYLNDGAERLAYQRVKEPL